MEPEPLLEEARSGSFFSYVAGVAYQALTYHQVQGLVVENDRTDLPIKKGLSSSAAICVLVARAFNLLYGLKLTVRGEMEMAYQGEISTASQCGRMDQGCAYGQRPVLMTFDGARLATREVSLGGPLHLLVVDLKAQKDTRTILARLNAAYPFAQGGVSQGVQELLGATNRRMVHEAVDALEQGDAQQLGALMVEAQAEFDHHAEPACPEELAAPVLHRVLAYEPLQAHVWGGKGVGSQGDGSAQFVCRSAADQDAAADIVARELGMDPLKLTLDPDAHEQRRAAFAVTRDRARLRTAVIPAAGRGTRLFPATKAIKKEMFPLVGHDGVARPALLVMAEEALSAGVERLVIVTQPGDVEFVPGILRRAARRRPLRAAARQRAARRAAYRGDRAAGDVRRAGSAGGVRARGILRAGGGGRRAVPADAGRLRVPVAQHEDLRAADGRCVRAARRERGRRGARAGGGDRVSRGGGRHVDRGSPAARPERAGGEARL